MACLCCGGGSGGKAYSACDMFHKTTAFTVSDSRQDFIIERRTRNWMRALLVAFVVAGVAGLTTAAYITDDSLRAGRVVVREEDYTALSQDQIEVAVCPCQNDTFPWSTFARYSDGRNYTGALITADCESFVTPEFAATPEPGAGSTLEENLRYVQLQSDWLANTLSLQACTTAIGEMSVLFSPKGVTHPAVRANPFRELGLLSQRQATRAVQDLIGSVLFRYFAGSSGQAQTEFLLQTLTRLELSSANQTAATALLDVSRNATTAALGKIQEQLGSNIVGRLQTNITADIAVDYGAYAQTCDPLYCEYTKKKSAWARVNEFLGLLGGLWTTVLGAALVPWFVLSLCL